MRSLPLIFLIASAVIAASAHAELIFCVGSDGQRVLRDIRDCPSARKSGAVTNPDTRTAPPAPAAVPMVPAAQYDTMRGAAPSGNSQETPPECKFRYFTLGDDKGKVLAENAKQECIRNKALKAAGQANGVSYDAYTLWKDHFEIESNRRNEALDRLNAANAANAAASAAASAAANAAANRPNRDMRCRPDNLGGLRCEDEGPGL